MNTLTVGIIGFGEVGSLLHDSIAAAGHSVRVWDRDFEWAGSPARGRLESRPAMSAAPAADQLPLACDVVVSVVTAENALPALDSVIANLERGATYLDLNSVAPETKRRLAERLASTDCDFVEGVIMSPISPHGVAAPVLLAGPGAEAFLVTGKSLGFSRMSVASEEFGIAAATKMCRSVVIKGFEALITESMLAARVYGVEADVLRSLGNLLPHEDWEGYAWYMIRRSLEHGARRAEEMREVSRMVSDAGLEPLMSAACASRQEWAARFPVALEAPGLALMLDAILEVNNSRQREELA